MKLLLFLLLLPILITGQVTTTKFFIEGKYPGVLYKPSTWDAAKKYTLVFFFHGKDEKGDGTDASLTQRIINSGNHSNLLANAEKYGFIVVAPQLVVSLQSWQSGWTQGYMRRYFEYALKNFNVDTNYFHVTGLSLGGGGVWTAICDPVWSKKIASAVPICGTPEYANDFLQPAINGVAVWAHHAKNDQTVALIHSENQVRYINEKSPKIPARLTIHESGGHFIWGSVYNTDSVYKWMLSYKKGTVVPPIVNPPLPTKKIKYRIIVYEDGSIEVVPEGTTSTPPPNPGPVFLSKLNIRPEHVYDLTQARKTPELLFDGDTTTVALPDWYNGYILESTGGQIVWVVLDSFVNNARVELYNGRWGYGGQVDFQFYYDITDTTRKSPVYSTTLPSLEWRSLETPWADSARLLRIRIADGGSNNFSEIKVYANKLGPAPSIFPESRSEPTDEGKYFMGYNKLSVDTLTDDAGYSQRNINDMNYIHPDPGKTDGKEIHINRYGNSIEKTYLPALRNGRKSHLSGAAVREGYKYPPHFTNDSKDMPRGADSTKASSWIPVYNSYYGLAAKMGHNKNADTTGYTYFNTPLGVGLGVLEEIEIGNEDDARWAGPLRFHSALVKLMKLMAGYTGVKAADPSLKVISGAITGIDTNYLKAMYFTRKLLGWPRDPFDIIAVNEYCTNAGGQHSGNSDGVSPEAFQLFEKLEGLIRVRDRYYPGKPVYTTEIGYDVHDGSNYEVPVIPGQTREQTKAMWGLRCFEIGAAARVSRVYWYTQEQGGGGDFSTTGFAIPANVPKDSILPKYLDAYRKQNGGWTSLPVDLYWYMTCRAKVLENYKAWPELIRKGDTSGVWVLRYDHLSDATKKIYSIWVGSSRNQVLNNYQLSIPGAISAMLYTPAVGIKRGSETVLTVSNETVWIPVNECVKYIVVTLV
jgi:hypothetical protein